MTDRQYTEDAAVPEVRIKEANYENVVVDCPSCKSECVFNRVSDLKTTNPIDGTPVHCVKCRNLLWIFSDSVNERHEMLIFDCHSLLERKQYMYSILNLTTAYEMFFRLFLRVDLLYKPLATDFNSQNLDEMNRLSEKLERRIQKFGFTNMRDLFLMRITSQVSPANLCEAKKIIEALPKKPKSISNAKINKMGDISLTSFLIKLNRSKIQALRNDIVHKKGYRPTREEAKNSLDEAKEIIMPLTSMLNLHDDPYWHYSRHHTNS